MEVFDGAGVSLHNPDAEARREAARMLGSIRTERKAESSRKNAAKRRGLPLSEEHKARLRQAQQERRERERKEREALGFASTVEKKPVGRPRKQTTEGTDTPKRGRGRPKKMQTGETLPMESSRAENGTGGL